MATSFSALLRYFLTASEGSPAEHIRQPSVYFSLVYVSILFQESGPLVEKEVGEVARALELSPVGFVDPERLYEFAVNGHGHEAELAFLDAEAHA